MVRPLLPTGGQPICEHHSLILKYTLRFDILPEGGICILNTGLHGYLNKSSNSLQSVTGKDNHTHQPRAYHIKVIPTVKSSWVRRKCLGVACNYFVVVTAHVVIEVVELENPQHVRIAGPCVVPYQQI